MTLGVVLIAGLRRTQNREDDVDRLTVEGVPLDAVGVDRNGDDHALQAVHLYVRDGNVVADSRRGQGLAFGDGLDCGLLQVGGKTDLMHGEPFSAGFWL